MIFISYRRDDNAVLAARLRDVLRLCLGPSARIFFDVKSIDPGEPFADVIRRSIEKSSSVLALIGPAWHPERLLDSNDFVRFELVTAYELGKRVVPVLHTRQTMPTKAVLPQELHWLTERHAFVISDPPKHEDDMKDLAKDVAGWDPVPLATRVDAGHARYDSLDHIAGAEVLPGLKGLFTNPFRRRPR